MLFEGEESLFDFTWTHYFYFCFVGQLCRGKTVGKKRLSIIHLPFFSSADRMSHEDELGVVVWPLEPLIVSVLH